MDNTIRNVDDLRLEISRLQEIKTGQEVVLREHFNSPQAILRTATHLFSRSRPTSGTNSKAGHDLIGYLSKTFLPLTLNKTLFRKSGFVMRAIVRLVSGKISHFINDESAGTLWNKVKTALPQGVQEQLSPEKKKSVLHFLSSDSNRKNRAARSSK